MLLWTTVYHGARARFLYFECLQLVLRKQIAVLRREWGLPDKFEVRRTRVECVLHAAWLLRWPGVQVVCRDVWALHLSLLPRPPVSEEEVYGDVEEDGSDGESSSSSRSSGSSESSQDTLLAELMGEVSGSSSGTDDGADGGGKGKERAPRWVSARNRYEKPVGNVAVLMVACWVMRVPVMYGDIVR